MEAFFNSIRMPRSQLTGSHTLPDDGQFHKIELVQNCPLDTNWAKFGIDKFRFIEIFATTGILTLPKPKESWPKIARNWSKNKALPTPFAICWQSAGMFRSDPSTKEMYKEHVSEIRTGLFDRTIVCQVHIYRFKVKTFV